MCVFSEQIKLNYPSSAPCCNSDKLKRIVYKEWGRCGGRNDLMIPHEVLYDKNSEHSLLF